MNKSTIFTIVALLTCTGHAADSGLAAKKNQYKDSCQQTMMQLVLDKAVDHDLTSKAEMAIFSIKACRDLMGTFDKANSWAKVKTADFDACVDAVHVLVDPKKGEQHERNLRARYCADKMKL